VGRLYPGLEREMLESPAAAWLLPFAAGNDNDGRSPPCKAFLLAFSLSLSLSLFLSILFRLVVSPSLRHSRSSSSRSRYTTTR